MHVMIATTGALSPEPVVEFTRHLLGTTGMVSLTTVIEVPHDFLEALDTGEWHPLHGDRPSTRTELIARYVEERGRKLTEPVLLALQAATIPCELIYLEGSDAAETISQAARRLAADVVILGATRQIFDRDAWESVSARVMIESGRPVLVIPRPAKIEDDLDGEGIA
jgi:nucleotide-binding universal stress UspA family protein